MATLKSDLPDVVMTSGKYKGKKAKLITYEYIATYGEGWLLLIDDKVFESYINDKEFTILDPHYQNTMFELKM